MTSRTAGDQIRNLRRWAYVAFAFSGAAGLVYESVWSRYLGLFVGHAAYAQILVLAIFLGGLAVGAAIAAQFSARLRDPLVTYALVELVAGLIGLAFHGGFVMVTGWAYESVLPNLGSVPLRSAARWAIAAALLMPQAVLLGATFPLMAAGVMRRAPEQPGGVLSWLYFTNSLGAAVGVLVAGFGLLALVGLPGTVQTAGAVNIVVGIGVLLLARRHPTPSDAVTPSIATATSTAPSRLLPLLLGVSFGTAVASFIYEIGWLRLLGLVLGSATHTFEIMLSAFILGLALGAFWVRRRSDRWAQPVLALARVQWLMGFAALATLPLYQMSFGWTSTLLELAPTTTAGYVWFSVAKYGIGMAVMLPSTFLAGMTLPLITRTLVVAGYGEQSIGIVYAVNTLGAIVGAGTAGLVLLPVVGLQGMMVIGATLDMALGVWLFVEATTTARRPYFVGAVAATALAVVVGMTVGRLDKRVLVSGAFRTADRGGSTGTLRHYRDGRTATVSISEGGGLLTIATNGKADGSVPRWWLESCESGGERRTLSLDIATETLAPLITLAHVRQPRAAAVIGHGTGLSSHMLLAHPAISRVTTVEIEPAMIAASAAFFPANARAFDDPRSEFVIEDARSVFAARRDTFDVIFSEPSNPWVSGVSSLFTVEFYQHVARHLRPGGVFGQWLHLYEMEDDLLLSVVGALHAVFADYSLFLSSYSDLLIVAGQERLEADWSLFQRPSYRTEFCHVPPLEAQDFETLRLGDRVAFAPLMDTWTPVNSDFYPVLDLGAERARFLDRGALGFRGLSDDRVNLALSLSGRRIDVGTPRRPPADTPRAEALSRAATVRAAVPWTQRSMRANPEGVQGPVLQGVERSIELTQTIARVATWRGTIRGNAAPNDWRSWAAEFRMIEQSRAAGTVGTVDEVFYADIERYLAAATAPDVVRSVVGFHRAVAGWDVDRVAETVDSLLTRDDVVDWIDPVVVLEAGIAANWARGDGSAARRIWDRLSPRYTRAEGDLRRRLTESWLARASSRSP